MLKGAFYFTSHRANIQLRILQHPNLPTEFEQSHFNLTVPEYELGSKPPGQVIPALRLHLCLKAIASAFSKESLSVLALVPEIQRSPRILNSSPGK